MLGDALWEDISEEDFKSATLGESNFFERIKRVVALFASRLEVLSGRGDAKPDVILCCIPQPVIDYCATRMIRESGTSARVPLLHVRSIAAVLDRLSRMQWCPERRRALQRPSLRCDGPRRRSSERRVSCLT